MVAKVAKFNWMIKYSPGDKFVTYCMNVDLHLILHAKKSTTMRKVCISFLLLIIYSSIMAQNVRQSSAVLTDETCDVLRRAAMEKSREMNLDISFAIADADGVPRLFQRFGDALVLSTVLVPAKAYTSAITQTPTGDLREAVADNGNLMGMNSCDRRITLVPGGYPLFVNGKVVGAIGVGGGTKEQDLEIAKYILMKFDELISSK